MGKAKDQTQDITSTFKKIRYPDKMKTEGRTQTSGKNEWFVKTFPAHK